jgi:hypothetical protein
LEVRNISFDSIWQIASSFGISLALMWFTVHFHQGLHNITESLFAAWHSGFRNAFIIGISQYLR